MSAGPLRRTRNPYHRPDEYGGPGRPSSPMDVHGAGLTTAQIDRLLKEHYEEGRRDAGEHFMEAHMPEAWDEGYEAGSDDREAAIAYWTGDTVHRPLAEIERELRVLAAAADEDFEDRLAAQAERVARIAELLRNGPPHLEVPEVTQARTSDGEPLFSEDRP